MSFDPYGTGPDPHQPPRPGDPTAPLDVSYSPGGRPPIEMARDRVQLPGIFLIILGVLNLLPGVYNGGQFVLILMQDAKTYHAKNLAMMDQAMRQMEESPPLQEFFAGMRKTIADLSPEDFYSRALWQQGIASVILLLIAVLQVLGGVRMLQLKSYALVLVASILTVLPCLSLTGCCCIGQVVGIWAFVVLMTSEVRQSFS